ncbi:Glutamic acid-rich protein [Entamoeba marina]
MKKTITPTTTNEEKKSVQPKDSNSHVTEQTTNENHQNQINDSPLSESSSEQSRTVSFKLDSDEIKFKNVGEMSTETINEITTACENANYEKIKSYMDNGGVNLLYQDGNGKTFLHHFCEQQTDNIDVVKLIATKENSKLRDNDSKLALGYALINGLESCIKILLEINDRADVKECYDYGVRDIEKPKDVNRLGFFPTEDPEKKVLYSLKKKSNQKEKQEEERIKKWNKMAKHWEGHVSPKFERRVFKGVPDECRSMLWKRILWINEIPTGVSKEFKKYCKQGDRSAHDKQIDLDINRTFQLHYRFKVRHGAGQKELFDVLHALSKSEPELGYIQGMSSASSMFVLWLKSLEAYAATKIICNEKYKFKEMFLEFDLIQTCWRMTKIIIKKNYPQVFKHLKKLGITDEPMPFFIFEWHYLWFIHAFNIETSVRVFDTILLDGFVGLFSVTHAVLSFIKHDIVKIKVNETLQQKLKTPLMILDENSRPTTNQFMLKVWEKRYTKEEVDELMEKSKVIDF